MMNLNSIPRFEQLLARPGQPLEQHLAAVRIGLDMIRFKIPFFSIPADAIFGNDDLHPIVLPEWVVMDIMSILVACHDFGKVSPFFQAKIRKQKIGKQLTPLSYHTKTSAYFAFFLLKEYFETHAGFLETIPNELIDLFLTIIPYSIINHHTPKLKTTFLDGAEIPAETLLTLHIIHQHVFPMTFDITLPNSQKTQGNLVNLMLTAIACHPCGIDHSTMIFQALQKTFQLIDSNFMVTGPLDIPHIDDIAADEFWELLDDLEDLWKKTSQYPGFIPYFLFVHSVLADLDEWDARCFIPNEMTHTAMFDWNHAFPVSYRTISDYKHAQFRLKGLEHFRYSKLVEARNSLFEQVDTIKLKKHPFAYVIEAPTGSAKTLAMLHLAMRIAKKKEELTGTAPRIIYGLPFISITDQVGSVVRNILSFANANPKSDLTVHHMFSDFPSYIFEETFDEENDEVIIGKAAAETRLWHSPIIVTTFVSLMNTILSGVKRSILRFHRLAHSVVILDEVQSLPPKYWELLSTLTDHLIRYLNIDFVIGSATNPKPLTHAVRNVLPLHLPHNVLNTINRYKITIDTEPRTVEQAMDHIIIPTIDRMPTKQAMIVVNTRQSCRTIYDRLKLHFNEDDIYLLSTWLRPIDRKRTIEIVTRRLKADRNVILVSTQVVEAGVDLDFKTVFRDFAPLDSIIQVAGRCNRNFIDEQGTLYLLSLKGDQGRELSSYVYAKISLEVTKELLQQARSVCELDLRTMVDHYFNLVNQRRKTSDLMNEYNCSDIPKIAHEFSLIEEDPSLPVAFIPQRTYQSLNLKSKNTIKLLSLFSITIPKKNLPALNYITHKISGITVYIAILEDNPVYDPKGGYSGKRA